MLTSENYIQFLTIFLKSIKFLIETNASKAVGMGIVSLMLNLHKEYHKNDYRSEKVFLIRKTILLVLKNVSSLSKSKRFSQIVLMKCFEVSV